MELCQQRLGTARATNSAYPIPAGLTQANSNVIVAKVTYDFTPVANLRGYPNPGVFKMKQTFYARPCKSVQETKTN